MHPNREKLLRHALWLRNKGREHPPAQHMFVILADGFEEMASEERHTAENMHGETVLQRGLVGIMQVLQERKDPANPRFIAQMAEDVMWPLLY